jgi:hypothetical protein
MKIIIDSTRCFECGEPKQDMHHIIPKSKGGTKTIPLCAKCHGLVHGRDFVKHRQLHKEGVERAKLLGKYKGRVAGSGESKEVVLEKYKPVIEILNREPTMSLKKIADLCYEDMGRVISPNTVRKIKKLLK